MCPTMNVTKGVNSSFQIKKLVAYELRISFLELLGEFKFVVRNKQYVFAHTLIKLEVY